MSDDARQIAIAIIPKFTAFLSVIGSGFIAYDILCSHFNLEAGWWRRKKKNELSSDGFSRRTSSMQTASRARSSRRFNQRKTLKNSAYYRLMLAMSCSDFIVSFAWFCTTWPIPRDELSLDNPSESVYGNIGNTRTCSVQAFFIQLGIVTPFYNALLALYYYLTIRREWKEEEFKCRVEYAGHFVSVSWGVGTAVAGLVMELYNNSTVWCWIAGYPGGCGGPDNPCVRGKNFKSLRWVFYYGPLWVMIFLVALFMSLVYGYVRSLDNKMDQYTATYRNNAASNAAAAARDSGSGEFGPNGRRKSVLARKFTGVNTDTLNEQRRQRRNERSKAVANQGLFYAGTFALVWVFGTIVRAMQLAGKSPPWIIIFWFAVFTPSQGFFNFLVYVRPRLIKHFEEKKKKRQGRKNSKTGSSFNSDILHVSGISAELSSNEVAGENQNRDGSTRSDLDLSEPFTKAKPDPDISERGAKVRFAGDKSEESQFPTKVRFVADNNDRFVGKKEDSGHARMDVGIGSVGKKEDSGHARMDVGIAFVEKKEDSGHARLGLGIPSVSMPLDRGEIPGSTELDMTDDAFDEKTASSDETIDPDLLSPSSNDVFNGDRLDREESYTAEFGGYGGDEGLDLHNATINFATGEVVSTRGSLRRE